MLSLGMSLAPGSSFFFVLVDLLNPWTFFSVLAIELVDWSSHTEVSVHEPVIDWRQSNTSKRRCSPTMALQEVYERLSSVQENQLRTDDHKSNEQGLWFHVERHRTAYFESFLCETVGFQCVGVHCT